MITREQIEDAFREDRDVYKTQNVDHDFVAISLLRKRIPYDKVKNIICAAGYDVVYLCDVEVSMPYLSKEDLDVLADCNVWINGNDCFALFV